MNETRTDIEIEGKIRDNNNKINVSTHGFAFSVDSCIGDENIICANNNVWPTDLIDRFM